jgi:transmembrane sensor
MIRLQDNPAEPGPKVTFNAWLRASPVNAAAWGQTEHASRVIAAVSSRERQLAGGPAGSGAVHSLDGMRSRQAARRSMPRRIWRLSAFAAAACLALVAAPDLLLHLRADAVADTGEMKTVRLADGSVVRLAPGGALAIGFADNRRQVSLLRGSAYFEVAHDAARPFTIAAGGTTTTVLGTAFEIRRQGEGAAVTVRRGLVRVSCDDPSSSELLSVGQAVDLQCGRPASRSTVEPARVALWTDGQLVANDRPMSDVVDAIRPWYRGIIVVRGPGVDHRRVTGVYNLHEPRRALDALAAAHGARVSTITPWITVVSAD